MKKIFLAIICLTLWTSHAMAATTTEEQLEKLTREFLAHYNGELPPGTSVNADSTEININTMEFLADPVAKRYFEQMGKVLMAEKAADTQMKVEVNDFKLEEVPATTQAAMKMKKGTKRKSVAIPQLTFCLSVPYTYMSIDGENNPIRLSSIMYRPSPFQFNLNAKLGVGNIIWGLGFALIDLIKGTWNAAFGYTFDYGVLGCHPTVTTSVEAPTGKSPLDGDIKMFCSDYALVVCPDYCGYGLSEYRQHPYLVQGVTARNVVDAYIAALDLVNDKRISGASGSWSFASDFYTDLMGYSQGGSVALSTLRYLESGQVSDADLKRINLRNVYCGDGPYSPKATVKQYIDWSNMNDEKYNKMAYPCVLPLIVQAAKQAYDNDCMHTVKLDSYFTPEFLATGIVDMLDTKRVSTSQLNDVTTLAGTVKVAQIMSDNFVKQEEVLDTILNQKRMMNVFNTESNEYKCLMRAMEYNDLTKGWTPHHPLLFMHLDGDLVVPYCNMEEVKKNLPRDPSKKMVFTTPYEVKDKMTLIWELIADKVKDVFDNPDHSKIGVFFYIAAAAGAFEDMLSE